MMDNRTKKNLRLRAYTYLSIGIIIIILMFVNYNIYGQQFQIGDKLPLIQYKIDNQLIPLQPDTTKPNVLFIFKDKCSYCEMTLNDIDKNIGTYKNVNFYFFCIQNIDVKNSISKYKNILKKDFVTFGYLDNKFASDSLGVSLTPTIYIIKKSGILSSKIKGAVKFDVIDSAINKCGL